MTSTFEERFYAFSFDKEGDSKQRTPDEVAGFLRQEIAHVIEEMEVYGWNEPAVARLRAEYGITK